MYERIVKENTGHFYPKGIVVRIITPTEVVTSGGWMQFVNESDYVIDENITDKAFRISSMIRVRNLNLI